MAFGGNGNWCSIFLLLLSPYLIQRAENLNRSCSKSIIIVTYYTHWMHAYVRTGYVIHGIYMEIYGKSNKFQLKVCCTRATRSLWCINIVKLTLFLSYPRVLPIILLLNITFRILHGMVIILSLLSPHYFLYVCLFGCLAFTPYLFEWYVWHLPQFGGKIAHIQSS